MKQLFILIVALSFLVVFLQAFNGLYSLVKESSNIYIESIKIK